MSDDESMDVDAELARERELEQSRKKPRSPPPQGKGKGKANDHDGAGGAAAAVKLPAATSAGAGAGGAFAEMMKKKPATVAQQKPTSPKADSDDDNHGDAAGDDGDDDDDETGGGGFRAEPLGAKGKGKGKAKDQSFFAPVPTSTHSSSGTAASPDTLPWVEKYRPKSIDEIVSHGDIVTVIERFIATNSLPHLLFHGPAGTGKTSLILAVARKLYGPKFNSMILELNASDDRGIDIVRNEIKEFSSTRTIFSASFKLVILDEADAMTNPAQAALRRIIEKYTKNVRFCLICNYVSKIIPALQSRCTRFRFAPLDPNLVKIRLNEVVATEKVKIDEGGTTALLRLSNGDMRKTLNILQVPLIISLHFFISMVG